MGYTADQWLFFFFVYCFIGWIWESSFVSIRTRKLTNRGFMRGPFIPIYGCGCVLMLVVGMPLMQHPLAMYFTGLVCATVMEFVTGEAMLKIFRVRYWDYSGRFLNIKGHVCLVASILWGFFTLLMNYVGRIPIEKKVMMIPADALHIADTLLLVFFVADFSLSFKTALDLRDVIIALEHIREDIDRMEKRVDVMLAFANDTRDQVLDEIGEKVEQSKAEAKLRIEERMDELERRLDEAKTRLADMDIKAEVEAKIEESLEIRNKKRQELLDQISEFRLNNELMRRRLTESARRRGALYRNMIRNNILSSDGFPDILDEIKQRVLEYKDDGKGLKK